MATTRYDTVKNIVNAVARETKAAAEQTDVVGSSDANIIQMVQLLINCGQEMLQQHTAWEFAKKTHTFATVNGTAEYALPSDFVELFPQTGWNLTRDQPLADHLTEQWYQYITADSLGGLLLEVGFLLAQNKLVLSPTPTAAWDISFRYRARSWVQPNGQTTPTQDTITANDDIVWFDQLLAKRALKLAYYAENGYDTTKAQAQFDEAWERCVGQQVAKPKLSLVGRRGIHLIDECNIPWTGFGV